MSYRLFYTLLVDLTKNLCFSLYFMVSKKKNFVELKRRSESECYNSQNALRNSQAVSMYTCIIFANTKMLIANLHSMPDIRFFDNKLLYTVR